jgi:hypothetical protein
LMHRGRWRREPEKWEDLGFWNHPTGSDLTVARRG